MHMSCHIDSRVESETFELLIVYAVSGKWNSQLPYVNQCWLVLVLSTVVS